MQFWKNESFSLKSTNTIIGSDVKINQDSIHGYMGLGFDMSNFNEDGSDDVYTFGISMPIHMVQYCDSFTCSKYSHHLFPNDLLKMTILEMNNVDDLFRQNMIEFLQTDIDGSVDFLVNAITIQSLKKYLKTFHTPPLDIDQISSIWDQILCNPKTTVTVTEELWECARKVTFIPFQSSRQCFISVFRNIDFLNQLWSCYSSFIFKSNLLHLIIRYFLGINLSFLSFVVVVEKYISYKIDWETSLHGTHGYLSSSENIVINLSCQ
jgi:hypothetical protein